MLKIDNQSCLYGLKKCIEQFYKVFATVCKGLRTYPLWIAGADCMFL